jgi:hypothetical protein
VRHATVSRPIAAEQRQTKVEGCGLVTSQLRDVELGNCSFNLGGYVAGCTADRGKGDSSLAGMDEWHIEEKVSVSKFFAAKILICRVLPLDQQKKKLHLNSLHWIGISQKHGERPAKTLSIQNLIQSGPHPVVSGNHPRFLLSELVTVISPQILVLGALLRIFALHFSFLFALYVVPYISVSFPLALIRQNVFKSTYQDTSVR